MNKILKLSIPQMVLGLLAAMLLVAGVASANESTVKPVFNYYDSVNLHYGVGPESDFLRLGESGELGNTLEVCEHGQVVDLWFYVHNSEAAEHNGADLKGPGVATTTIVAVDLDEDAVGRSHDVTGSIDSDQTDPITDGVTITCGSKDIKVTYKTTSYFGSKAPGLQGFDNYSLTGNIRDGALLGYGQGDTRGIVPGCWDYRARINVQLVVDVVEPDVVPEPEPEIPPLGSSSDLNIILTMLILGISASAALGYRTYMQRS